MPKLSASSAPAPSPADPSTLSFEAALAELEAIVASMEGAGLALDASVAAYERGSALIRACQKHLEDAREKLQIVDASGVLKPLDLSK